jgi:L-ribulose-5-phosphate 4-epimerase
MDLTQLRDEVCFANKRLLATGLVTMHSGNASGLDRSRGRLVIKPSGVDYDKLAPEDLVEVDLDSGEVINSRLRPSVDLPHHLYLYRNMPGVGGIIHTHSNYATAFAALGRPIPLCLTAIADQFGAEIPCTPYVDNEGDHIGQMILKCRNRAPAALLQNHGVFTWGTTTLEALKVAVMTEDVAKTVHLALQLGQPKDISADEAKKWYDRYHHRYGQGNRP